MMIAVNFYRPDLKSAYPGYLNPAHVALIYEASTAEIRGVRRCITAVRTSDTPIPVFVVGSLNDIAARLDRGLD